MIHQDHVRGLLVLAATMALLTVVMPAAADGPLPTPEPTADGAQTAADNTLTTADVAAAYVVSAGQSADVALNDALSGSPSEAQDRVDGIVTEGSDGAVPRIVSLTDASAVAMQEALELQTEHTVTFGTLVGHAGLQAVGLEMDHGPSAAGVAVPVPGLDEPSCTSHPQASLDAAEPGDEILVCPGVYEPFTVATHFVTVRALQGPQATVVESDGGDGIQVDAAGVTIEGFQVRGATDDDAAAIRVGLGEMALDDRTQGQHLAPTIRENLLRGNTHGVVVEGATGALIEANTIRSSTDAAVLVLADGDEDTETAGTVVLTNAFLANQGLAIENQASTPVIAAANYYGSATGPSVMVQGGCIGLAALFGPATCHNGLGTGVITLGFSPMPLR